MKHAITPYALKTKAALPVREANIHIRKGYIISLTNKQNITGHGEVAPLSNYNNIYNQLSNINYAQLDSLWDNPEIQPCVKFGISSALYNLELKLENKSLLNNSTKKYIHINAMISEREPDPLAQALKYFNLGYREFKIKIGFSSLEQDIYKIQKIYEIIKNPNTKIKLDAKRNYSLEEAIYLLLKLKNIPILYIEDPLDNFFHYPELYQKTNIPIALDESLRLYNKPSYFEGLGAFVIKPSLTGSIKDCLDLMYLAKKYNIKAVISGYFESSLGLNMCALLAACTDVECSHGLSTYNWLLTDSMHPRFKATNAYVNVQSCEDNLRNFDLAMIKQNNFA
jgi:O-succinylbenzoate synthase